ncbi:hypothetical protein [Segatella bryantii]|jgi:hypothetical protein|uniref:hypothetical protein n=1 Tax=Segatella bryantii TaxID=77095 RepID=UPI00242CF9F6|nr:hypothetical protein [Segatella bryantii]
MKAKIFFRKQHKWIGIVVCLFILLFCISGIILNHRKAFGNVNVPRSWVPEQFQYQHWNNGLLRGTLPYADNSVLIYGKGIHAVMQVTRKNTQKILAGRS